VQVGVKLFEFLFEGWHEANAEVAILEADPVALYSGFLNGCGGCLALSLAQALHY